MFRAPHAEWITSSLRVLCAGAFFAALAGESTASALPLFATGFAL